MKRVHFKRKLPKVKVLDFQGGRCHTRYIRRSRVSHQSGSDRTVDVALSDSVHPDHPSCSSDEFGCMTEWSEKWNGLPSEEKEYYQGKAAQSKGLVNDPSRAKKALLKEMYQLTSNLLATGVDLACIGFDDDDKVIIIGDGKVGNHIRNQPALLNEILGHERSRSTNPVPDSTTSLKELKKMA